MITPVIEEINQFVQKFGRENNYHYILGNVGNGNIMYGNPANDITEDIILGLNGQYYKALKELQ